MASLDVTDPRFGAVGDGHTNDRLAIQRALDSAAGRGATVVLPSGGSFLSGDLRIGDDTTLRIDGVLRQSSDPGHYSFVPGIGHDLPSRSLYGSYLGGLVHPPLVLASRARRVTVTGGGSIELMGGGDDAVINVAPIGLYRVEDFEISDVTILDAHSWNIMLFTTNVGVVRDVTIRSSYRNSDGICIFNSQDIRITGNHLEVADDGIYVRTGWKSYVHDPGLAWWSDRWPQPARNIEVDHNTVVSETRGSRLFRGGHGVRIRSESRSRTSSCMTTALPRASLCRVGVTIRPGNPIGIAPNGSGT